MYEPLDNCILYNDDCLKIMKKDLSYHYVITSPPDFNEIGENPDESMAKWERLMYDAFSMINPINNVATIILRDRKS